MQLTSSNHICALGTPLIWRPSPSATWQGRIPKGIQSGQAEPKSILKKKDQTLELKKFKYHQNVVQPAPIVQEFVDALFSEQELSLPGSKTAQTAILLSRSRSTFAGHVKWWKAWSWYCVAHGISVKEPKAQELAAFVGWVVEDSTAGQGIKALSSVRQQLHHKSDYYGANCMLLACLSDGLKAMAVESKRPKVAIQLDTLNYIINHYLSYHSVLHPKIVRMIAFAYLMYGSGARPGELHGMVWDQVVLVDNTLAEVGTLLDMGMDKLDVGVYRIKLEFWEKQSRYAPTFCIIPCNTITTTWLKHLWTSMYKLIKFQKVALAYMFPNLDGHTMGHVSYSAMSEQWDELRGFAFEANIISREQLDHGTIYAIKRGLITDLQEENVPLSLSMALTRHRSVTGHLAYFTPLEEEQQKKVVQMKERMLQKR